MSLVLFVARFNQTLKIQMKDNLSRLIKVVFLLTLNTTTTAVNKHFIDISCWDVAFFNIILDYKFILDDSSKRSLKWNKNVLFIGNIVKRRHISFLRLYVDTSMNAILD